MESEFKEHFPNEDDDGHLILDFEELKTITGLPVSEEEKNKTNPLRKQLQSRKKTSPTFKFVGWKRKKFKKCNSRSQRVLSAIVNSNKAQKPIHSKQTKTL